MTSTPEITDAEFDKIKDIMHKATGVFLKPSKKFLVISRLRRRLGELHLKNFGQYADLLKKPGSKELDYFVNAITTNETFFFRHDQQFEYMTSVLFPYIMKKKSTAVAEIKIWSAACSTGEEPYTIAIACDDFQKKHPGIRFSINATDINSEVVDKAKAGIFPARSMRGVSQDIIKKNFQIIPATEPLKDPTYSLNPAIKSKVKYGIHNLLDLPKFKNVDIIFLRNVMIYFTQETKEKVVANLMQAMPPGAHLFISLSESLHNIGLPIEFIKSGIYRKTA